MSSKFLSFALAVGVCGCATSGRAMIYTEEGVRLAEQEWHRAYNDRLDHCQAQFQPQTPAAEDCFGRWFDADQQVELVVRSAVVSLRAYWVARAAGQKPQWRETAAQVHEMFKELPDEAKMYFERVRGLK